MAECGGIYSEWYVGISENARSRLFQDHSVDEKNDNWIFSRAMSSETARRIEQHFLSLGTKGGPGGGDNNADFVYAYKINSHTIE